MHRLALSMVTSLLAWPAWIKNGTMSYGVSAGALAYRQYEQSQAAWHARIEGVGQDRAGSSAVAIPPNRQTDRAGETRPGKGSSTMIDFLPDRAYLLRFATFSQKPRLNGSGEGRGKISCRPYARALRVNI